MGLDFGELFQDDLKVLRLFWKGIYFILFIFFLFHLFLFFIIWVSTLDFHLC